MLAPGAGILLHLIIQQTRPQNQLKSIIFSLGCYVYLMSLTFCHCHPVLGPVPGMLLLSMKSRQSLLSPIAHQQQQLHRTLTRMCSQDAAVDADTPAGPVRRSPRTHPKQPPPLSNVPRQRLPTVSGAELRKQQQQQQSTPVAAPSTPMQPAGRPPELQSLLVEPTWRRVLLPEFQKPYMTQLEAFLQQQWASTTVYPPQQSIFSAFNSVPFHQVGQRADSSSTQPAPQ